MTQDIDPLINRDIPNRHIFLKELFEEAGEPDLFQRTDERRLIPDLFDGVQALTTAAGGELQAAGNKSSRSGASGLNVLLGKRIHLKLKTAAWEMLVVTVPLMIKVMMVSIDPGDFAAGAAWIQSIVGNLQRLEPNDWRFYLAVRKVRAAGSGPAALEDVAEELVGRFPKETRMSDKEIEARLERLVSKGVLEQSIQGYVEIF